MVYRSYCGGRPTSTHESAPRRYFDSSLSKFYLMSQLPALQLHHTIIKHCINRCAMEVFRNSDVFLLPSAASSFTSAPIPVFCRHARYVHKVDRTQVQTLKISACPQKQQRTLCNSAPVPLFTRGWPYPRSNRRHGLAGGKTPGVLFFVSTCP